MLVASLGSFISYMYMLLRAGGLCIHRYIYKARIEQGMHVHVLYASMCCSVLSIKLLLWLIKYQ